MKTRIEAFLATKSLAENSRAAYRYDLQLFWEGIDGTLEPSKLQAYVKSLLAAKPSVRRRKLSAINQFLYYLYQEGQVATYHKVTLPKDLGLVVTSRSPQMERLDLSVLWQVDSPPSWGQLAALMIWQLGLTPSELLALRHEDCQLGFQVLLVHRGQAKRVLSLPDELLPILSSLGPATYLFGQGDRPRSRQWLFNQLRLALSHLGWEALTAQSLREQYILGQVSQGKTIWELAQNLGLKSTATLEKYYR